MKPLTLKSLTLNRQEHVNRKLSIVEYYHAAVSKSSYTLELPRISVMVIDGSSHISATRWETALQHATDANPGAGMRLHGHRQNARWSTTHAKYPHLRFVENCTWDGQSNKGMEFIDDTELNLEDGPVAELIVVNGEKNCVIFRVYHAVMDGMGMVHFLREIFRAMRSEPLIGSNAAFSDFDLMRAITQRSHDKGNRITPLPLTGGAIGKDMGDEWRLLKIPLTKQKNINGRVAELSAQYAWRFNAGVVRVAMPVDLRRHMPGLVSTMNFTGMLHVDFYRGDTAQDFRQKVRASIDAKKDAICHPIMDLFRYFPFEWVDYITGRRKSNYLQRTLVETVLITNLGIFAMHEFSCEGFSAQNFFSIPVPGNAFISIYTCDQNTNFVIGMPKVYASNGRMDEFLNNVLKEFE